MSMGKIGRNEPCPCGSGKKYKKCCLGQYYEPIFTKEVSEEIDQEDDLNEVKISKIIIDYAQDLLKIMGDKIDQEIAINLVIAAWNLSMFKENERTKALSSLLKKMVIKDGSNESKAINYLMQTLISRKQQDYPDLNRFIEEHYLSTSKNEIRLTVVSTIFDN